jgi:hypothetical protein
MLSPGLSKLAGRDAPHSDAVAGYGRQDVGREEHGAAKPQPQGTVLVQRE